MPSQSSQATAEFEIRWHEPTNQYWVYIPAGTDPADGRPLVWARPATEKEMELHESARVLAHVGQSKASLKRFEELRTAIRENGTAKFLHKTTHRVSWVRRLWQRIREYCRCRKE